MSPSGERISSIPSNKALADELQTSPSTIGTLRGMSIPDTDIPHVLEVREYLSREQVSTWSRWGRTNDIVSAAAIGKAYLAVSGDLDDFDRLAQVALRMIDPTLLVRGAMTRALYLAIERYNEEGKNIDILEEKVFDGTFDFQDDPFATDISPEDEELF